MVAAQVIGNHDLVLSVDHWGFVIKHHIMTKDWEFILDSLIDVFQVII